MVRRWLRYSIAMESNSTRFLCDNSRAFVFDRTECKAAFLPNSPICLKLERGKEAKGGSYKYIDNHILFIKLSKNTPKFYSMP